MMSLLRGAGAAFSAIATFYMVGQFGGVLAMMIGLPGIAAFLGALVAAFWVGRFVWSRGDALDAGLARSVIVGALATGTIGFIGGFFGPIIFAPEANQGPLLGLLITGPLGFVLGGVGGAARWFVAGRSQG